MNEIEERWAIKCSLCKNPKPQNESWGWTHCGGLTFEFCHECEKDRQAECDKLMGDVVGEHIRKIREYWDTHPEELARHKRETEEYRKTLDADGYPMDFKRPWHKKIWNWFCRLIGYTMFDRHGRPTGRSRHASAGDVNAVRKMLC